MEQMWVDFNDEDLYNLSIRYGLSKIASRDASGNLIDRPLVELALTLFEYENFAKVIQ